MSSIALQFDMVNVPDLLRFPIRSWEACGLARRRGFRAIPHIRAMDFPPNEGHSLAQKLHDHRLTEVLVVRGDAPQNPTHAVYPTTSADLILSLKCADPQLRIFAGFDPYRRGLKAELDVVKEKLDAGASGLFTQPFFDLRYAEMCAELLPNTEVFWGMSPVLTGANRSYWEITNRVVMPPSFQLTMDWNRDFARRFRVWAKTVNGSLYVMPIRTNLSAFLSGLFD